ncbi:TonB-dependent receptor plug domain-containing protein [Sphingomonas sp. PAMC 26617]|uniref:TonB-dependent receptor plug domain-containing protein n=1 Tax=Sphingomonas sp. PAMC 26617 TaxID=1112216 RepID=UPI0002FB65C4|nr:TonB-dependent receptor [Sphingomonas sp. PAMC 26617]
MLKAASTISIIAGLLGSGTAYAQTAPAGASAPAPQATPDAAAHAAVPEKNSDIVVTGSRIVRNGFQAPTPVSVIGGEEINAKAPANLATLVNTLPALANSATPQNYNNQVSSGLSGINALNLRAIGGNRTLVLLDGQRVGASTLTGLVDINQFPEQLVKRVDVVTGGASADYGSDAVAGVVNFVLDDKFTGIKGEVSGGLTTYGDDGNYKVSLAAGTAFAGGRGHVILSGEYAHTDGINFVPRPWATNANEKLLFNNPNYTATNGQPFLLVRSGSGFATATPGGIITAGALKGTYFGPGGVALQYNYGPIVSGNFMQGGQSAYSSIANAADLDTELTRKNVFFRTSFDVSDHFQIFGQASYAEATTFANALVQFNFANITVQPDNAFIPASIASKVTAPLTIGSFNQDLGPITNSTNRKNFRFVGGFSGDFNALGSNWTYDFHAQETVTKIYTAVDTTITANYKNGIDSVRNANGQIVCRVTLTNPSSGCVPYDIFGTGVNDAAALNYVKGTAWGRSTLKQNNEAFNIRGNPFSTWAGPVSVAAGLEYRRESVTGTNDPLSTTNSYFVGNFHASTGSYNVTEGYLETVIPFAKDLPFAKSLEFNGAVRGTSYSTSGYVTTWKAGLTYAPVSDIRFRFTRSRDIRAPNLAELFNAAQTGVNVVVDTVNPLGLATPPSYSAFQVTSGNVNLKPEVADTLGLGAVFTPTFLPGFAASVDYYRIHISDAITTFTSQQIVNLCSSGGTAFCPLITRTVGTTAITSINVSPQNVATQIARGIDFEASYRRPLLGGTITVRALATRFLENYINNKATPATDNVGTNSNNGSALLSLPKWRYLAELGYDNGPFSVLLTGRGIGSGVYNTSFIECSSNCPTSTTANMTIENNRIPGAFYMDADIHYKLRKQVDLFMSVNNVFNTDPVMIAYGPAIGAAPLSVNGSAYDILGRTFRWGVRFQF